MSAPSPVTLGIWHLLLQQGGWWTAPELAAQTHGVDAADLSDHDTAAMRMRLRWMRRLGLIAQRPRRRGEAKNSPAQYGVIGTCKVPAGVTVAEVQA